jgi:hypothetical protein
MFIDNDFEKLNCFEGRTDVERHGVQDTRMGESKCNRSVVVLCGYILGKLYSVTDVLLEVEITDFEHFMTFT